MLGRSCFKLKKQVYTRVTLILPRGLFVDAAHNEQNQQYAFSKIFHIILVIDTETNVTKLLKHELAGKKFS